MAHVHRRAGRDRRPQPAAARRVARRESPHAGTASSASRRRAVDRSGRQLQQRFDRADRPDAAHGVGQEDLFGLHGSRQTVRRAPRPPGRCVRRVCSTTWRMTPDDTAVGDARREQDAAAHQEHVRSRPLISGGRPWSSISPSSTWRIAQLRAGEHLLEAIQVLHAGQARVAPQARLADPDRQERIRLRRMRGRRRDDARQAGFERRRIPARARGRASGSV